MRSAMLLACLAAAGCSNGFPGAVDAGADSDGHITGAGPSVLPFAVDDWYGPSGYMGDGSSPGGISDAQTCLADRPAAWAGNCHRYTWTPGSMHWGGVYWQYPDGNWGDLPGLVIPPGATHVTFQAWGAHGGEVVTFMAGMMAVDGFEASQMGVVLTTEPTAYSIDLNGTAYGKVVGGFGWTAADSTTAVTFGLDDIRWE